MGTHNDYDGLFAAIAPFNLESMPVLGEIRINPNQRSKNNCSIASYAVPKSVLSTLQEQSPESKRASTPFVKNPYQPDPWRAIGIVASLDE
jgi:hypothetical protein